MTLESSKNLGGIGSILLLIGVLTIPGAQPYLALLALIGFILVLIGLHGLASYYKDDGIFDNALYGFIATIVGVVATALTAIYVIFYTSILRDFLYKIFPTWDGTWSSLIGMTNPDTSNIKFDDVTPIIGAGLAVLAILWIFLIISTYFDRRSLKKLSAKANVGLFSTAGLLLLVGAFLTIILIGLVLMWVGILLMTIAFFQIRPEPVQPVPPSAPPP